MGCPCWLSGKESTTNAGDTGSMLDPERSHMLQSSFYVCGPQLLSLHSRTCEPQLLEPMCLEPVLCNKRSQDNEKRLRHTRK